MQRLSEKKKPSSFAWLTEKKNYCNGASSKSFGKPLHLNRPKWGELLRRSQLFSWVGDTSILLNIATPIWKDGSRYHTSGHSMKACRNQPLSPKTLSF